MTEDWGSPRRSQDEARRRPGTPCWVSLRVHRLAAIQDFYAALFGWSFSPGPQQLGPFVHALLDDRVVAGLGQLPPDRPLPVGWTTYLASDDADATAEQIRYCGGTLAVGPLDAGDAGRLAIASDPTGAVFGVWQGHGQPGAEAVGEAGTPVWNTLLTREAAPAGKFYASVFGYETQAVVGDPDQLTLLMAGRPVATVHGVGSLLPRDRGPHWMTYFEVADTDVAASRVIELGGRILRPPEDSERGRVATVADPEGAVLTLVRTAR